jgi:DNA polymerase elongation subunit (family B)
MKKKYVARKLENFEKVIEKGEQPVFNLEYKGIEVVRRDGFELARKFLRRMIEMLMNS